MAPKPPPPTEAADVTPWSPDSGGGLASPQQGPGCERRGKFGGERGIRTPDTLAGTPDFESGAFSRSASSPESDDRVTQRWRRGWDSNPRYVSVYTLSKRAPSAARPPLQFQTCFLRWRKNSRKISPQSCARTPLTTCTRWFKRPSRTRSNRVSTAPALGSATPYTSRSMRALTSAPAHIGQGSRVAYIVAPESRQLPSACDASCNARISACAVGS